MRIIRLRNGPLLHSPPKHTKTRLRFDATLDTLTRAQQQQGGDDGPAAAPAEAPGGRPSRGKYHITHICMYIYIYVGGWVGG